MKKQFISAVLFASALVFLVPTNSLGCPICFNLDPDSQIVQGVNWAVFALLGITGGVLSGFVGFILHLVKRSRQTLGQDDRNRPQA